LSSLERRIAAAASAIVFALHPVQVEAVAWASAFPYVLSLGALLLAFVAYLNGRTIIALAAYALSLLSRPIALSFPIVLFLADMYPLDRRNTTGRRLAVHK